MRRLPLALGVGVLALAVMAPATCAKPDVSAYRGTGSWVDLYDPSVRENPELAVAEMFDEGVRTIYVETGNHRLRRSRLVGYPQIVARLLDAAHSLGMRAVAWYLPGLTDRGLDKARSLAAIGLTTPAGQRFDSFALDIESTLIASIWRRNLALLRLSRAVRRAVGRGYPLGAIVPDQRSTTISPGLWPGFPYRYVAPLYDAILPMSYSTHRVHGAGAVYGYTYRNIRFIRAAIGRRSPPIHLIAGLANRLRRGEPSAAVRAARDAGAIGVSFYKFTWSGSSDWLALRLFDR